MKGRNQKKILGALSLLKFAPDIQRSWGKYIVGFAIRLFEGESAAGKRSLAQSTIRDHVRVICRRFIGLLSIESIETVNLDELVAAYGQALDNAIDDGQNPGLRVNLVRSLREFHHYLHTNHNMPAVTESEVFGTENGLPAVNANIVSYEEYLKIRKRLRTPDVTRRDWLCRIEDLIFMLAFCCGLRRMEVFGLTIDDLRWFRVQDGANLERQVELLIRPSRLRNPKTKNSARKIPMGAFVAGQDLRAILSWKQQRTDRHKASKDDLLFHHPELATLREPERTITEHIHEAMREITGDPSLHLHHLRHSFATWTFFRLMLSDFTRNPLILGLQPTTSQWLKKSKKLRLRLYGNEFPTRKHAYAVANLLGHSSPDISLEHYIHCMDWILAASLANSVILAPGKRTLDAVSGKALRTARRWRSTKKNSNAMHNQNGAGGIAAADQFAGRTPYENAVLMDPQASKQISPMERVERLLPRYEFDGISQRELAAEFLLTPDEVNAMICRAQTIKDRRSRHGVKGFVHKMTTIRGRRLCVPLKPHLPFSKSIADACFQKLAQWNNTDLAFQRVQETLDYYAAHRQRSLEALLFRSIKEANNAQKYLDLLGAMKPPTNGIKLLSYDSRSHSRHRAAWRRALGLSHRVQIERCVLPSGNTSRSAQWLGIKPDFPSPTGTADNDLGANGLNYAMLLGYIAFGKTSSR